MRTWNCAFGVERWDDWLSWQFDNKTRWKKESAVQLGTATLLVTLYCCGLCQGYCLGLYWQESFCREFFAWWEGKKERRERKVGWGFRSFILCSFCTAWDSEIESLTSLIKLHQKERRSAPCGQIDGATQPPVDLHQLWKSFELHERSKLDELARAVMIGRLLFLIGLSTISFQSFVPLAVLKNTNIAVQVRCVDDTCLILCPATQWHRYRFRSGNSLTPKMEQRRRWSARPHLM